MKRMDILGQLKQEDAPIAGKISQATAKDVTIDDPTKGIKITVPSARLTKDEQGNLTLAKPAATASGAAPTQQQNPIKPGAQVNIQPDALEDVHRTSSMPAPSGDEEQEVGIESPISGDEAKDNFVSRMLKLAGL